MTGSEHYAEAERLLAVADRHTSGVAYGPEWTLTLTAAHVHATLTLAAATAVGTAGADRTAWVGLAGATGTGQAGDQVPGRLVRKGSRGGVLAVAKVKNA